MIPGVSSSQGDAKEVVHHHATSSTPQETKNEAMQLSSAEVSSSSKDNILQQQHQHNQQQQQQPHGHMNVKGMNESGIDMDKSMPPPGVNWGIQSKRCSDVNCSLGMPVVRRQWRESRDLLFLSSLSYGSDAARQFRQSRKRAAQERRGNSIRVSGVSG